MEGTLKDEELKRIEYIFQQPSESDSFNQAHFRIVTKARDNIPKKELKLKDKILKRGIDILISAIAIIFILPWLFLLVGILIKLESKGPILFKQLRSGSPDKLFWCYKFRTMFLNDQSDLLQASRDDKRVTRIGRFLRKSSVDEFPQFLNILMGDMSLVGPRPHMPSLDQRYSPRIHRYSERLAAKQGLTGWAQVNGFRGETNDLEFMEKRIEHDLWYLENWSIGLDFKIIWLTLFLWFKDEHNAY